MVQKVIMITVLGSLAAAVLILGSGLRGKVDANDPASVLAYLPDIDEVRWHEVDGDQVYIVFRKGSKNIEAKVQRAAVRGSRANRGEFHAWGLVAAKKGWRPGDDPKPVYDVIAKNGQLP